MANGYLVTRTDLGKCAGRFFDIMNKPEHSTEKALGLEGKTAPTGKPGDIIMFGMTRSGKMSLVYLREGLGQLIRGDIDIGRSELPQNSSITVLCRTHVPGYSDSGTDVHKNRIQYRFFRNETANGKLYGFLVQLKYM